MKVFRRAAIPVVILLSACGGSSDGEDPVPVTTAPGIDVPVLEDETNEPPVETPSVDPSPMEPEIGPGSGQEIEPEREPEPGQESEPESETETEQEIEPGTEPEPGQESEPGTASESEQEIEPEQEPEPESGTEPVPPTENPSMPDPMTQNETSVSFQITVPAYMSSELQVRITWGDKSLAGVWNGDESWSAVDDFPTDEERLLVVDFLDRNGDLGLGTFERDFRTGTNAAETYTVGADDFDTARWDTDGDGASNLDELLAGTDPLFNDRNANLVQGPPDDEEATPLGTIGRVSAFFEAMLPKTRPYSESLEIRPVDIDDIFVLRGTRLTTIDIDETGTGSFSNFVETRNVGNEDFRRETREATRTVADGVRWSGTYRWSVSSAGLSESFTFSTDTKAVGERISQTGEIERDAVLISRLGRTDIRYDLIGERIDGTPRCEPVSGRVQIFERTGLEGLDPDEKPVNTMIFKELADRDWRTETRYEDGSLQGSRLESLGIEFHCDFGEL